VKSGKDVPFEGFVKRFHPTPTSPKSENFAYENSFSRKTCIGLHLGKNAAKIRIRIGKKHMGISNSGLKI